jgi:hypothetical protein
MERLHAPNEFFRIRRLREGMRAWEELRLLRAGDPARPGMLPPEVDALYDAFKHPRAERPSLPLLPPVEARAYDHEVRGRVLDLIEHTAADELFTAGMVVQHEEQHDETMLATLQLRQGPPVLLGRRPLPPGRDVDPDRVFVGGGRSRLAWTRQVSRSRSTTSGLRTPWTSGPSGSAGSRSVTGRGASSSATSGTSGRSCGSPAAGRTGPRLTIPLVLGRTPCRLPRSSRWQATRLLADAQNICSGASLERKSGTLRKHRMADTCAPVVGQRQLRCVTALWTQRDARSPNWRGGWWRRLCGWLCADGADLYRRRSD